MSTQIQITSSSGLTIGTTPITSGTDMRVLFQNSGVVSQDTGFIFDSFNKTLWNNGKGGFATNNSFGQNAISSNTTGIRNTAFGRDAGKLNTTGNNNTFFGFGAGGAILGSNLTGSANTIIGYNSGAYLSTGVQNTFIGANAGTSITSGSYNTIIGYNGISFPTSFTQNVIISDGQSQTALWKDSNNYIGFGYYPGSDTLGAKVDIKSQGALSTDVVQRWRNSADSANIGKITGDGAFTLGTYTNPSAKMTISGSTSINFASEGGSTTAGYFQPNQSSTTLYGIQALARQNGANIGKGIYTGADGSGVGSTNYGIHAYAFNGTTNYAGYFDATGGTTNIAIQVQRGNMVFGVSPTLNKIGFWNATPIVQPTTAIASAAFVTNTSLIANDTATFDGYTIGQVVKALRNLGILA